MWKNILKKFIFFTTTATSNKIYIYILFILVFITILFWILNIFSTCSDSLKVKPQLPTNVNYIKISENKKNVDGNHVIGTPCINSCSDPSLECKSLNDNILINDMVMLDSNKKHCLPKKMVSYSKCTAAKGGVKRLEYNENLKQYEITCRCTMPSIYTNLSPKNDCNIVTACKHPVLGTDTSFAELECHCSESSDFLPYSDGGPKCEVHDFITGRVDPAIYKNYKKIDPKYVDPKYLEYYPANFLKYRTLPDPCQIDMNTQQPLLPGIARAVEHTKKDGKKIVYCEVDKNFDQNYIGITYNTDYLLNNNGTLPNAIIGITETIANEKDTVVENKWGFEFGTRNNPIPFTLVLKSTLNKNLLKALPTTIHEGKFMKIFHMDDWSILDENNRFSLTPANTYTLNFVPQLVLTDKSQKDTLPLKYMNDASLIVKYNYAPTLIPISIDARYRFFYTYNGVLEYIKSNTPGRVEYPIAKNAEKHNIAFYADQMEHAAFKNVDLQGMPALLATIIQTAATDGAEDNTTEMRIIATNIIKSEQDLNFTNQFLLKMFKNNQILVPLYNMEIKRRTTLDLLITLQNYVDVAGGIEPKSVDHILGNVLLNYPGDVHKVLDIDADSVNALAPRDSINLEPAWPVYFETLEKIQGIHINSDIFNLHPYNSDRKELQLYNQLSSDLPLIMTPSHDSTITVQHHTTTTAVTKESVQSSSSSSSSPSSSPSSSQI